MGGTDFGSGVDQRDAGALAQTFHDSVIDAVDLALDLADFEDVQVGAYVVKNPKTLKKTDFVVFLAGPEHPIRKKQEHARVRKLRQEAAKTGRVQFDDPADEDRENTMKLVDCILGWDNATFGGESIEFSRDAAYKLLFNPKLRWLRNQLIEGLDTTDVFIKGCAG